MAIELPDAGGTSSTGGGGALAGSAAFNSSLVFSQIGMPISSFFIRDFLFGIIFGRLAPDSRIMSFEIDAGGGLL